PADARFEPPGADRRVHAGACTRGARARRPDTGRDTMSEARAPMSRPRPDRLSVEEARARVLAEVAVVSTTERLALRAALRRVLAEDVASPIDVPAHTNAAVDGYALAGAGLPAQGKKEFAIVGTAWAGRPYE